MRALPDDHREADPVCRCRDITSDPTRLTRQRTSSATPPPCLGPSRHHPLSLHPAGRLVSASLPGATLKNEITTPVHSRAAST